MAVVFATSLLLMFDSGFTDSSPNNVAITNSGVTISTAQSKFGGASAYFDGSSHLLFNDSAVVWGADNFTIDWWEYATSEGTGENSQTRFSGCFGNTTEWGGMMLGHMQGTRICMGTALNTWDSIDATNALSITVGEWVHWAVVRTGSTLKTYRNGEQYYSGAITGAIYNSGGTYNCAIGALRAQNLAHFIGYIDAFRISKVALWTADFTPPTEEDYDPFAVAPMYVWDRYSTKTVYAEQYTSGNATMSFNDIYDTIYFGTSYTFSTSNGRFTIKSPSYAGDGYGRPDVLNAKGYMTNGSYASGTSSDPMIYNNNPFWTTEDNQNWYISNYSSGRRYTHTTSKGKGSINSSVSSASSSAYPNNAISGSYWYTYRGAPSGISYPATANPGEPITITWTAGTNPLYYRVERSTDGGSTWTVLSAVVTATTYTDTDIATSTATQVMYRVCTLGERAVSDYSTGGEVFIPRCSVRVKVGGEWVKGTASFIKVNGAWQSIPMADEAALFGAQTRQKVILLTS